jgi:putative transposase
VKYAFVESDLVEQFPLPVICRVLGVTQAGYHAWLKRPASGSELERVALEALVQRVYDEFGGKYGAPRIHRALCQEHGYTGSYERVRLAMQRFGLKAKAGRKFKATTDSAHTLPIAPNLLGQDFTATHASAPNQVWLSDITYLWTAEGWLYTCCVLDLFTREIVGWAIASHMRQSLVMDAIRMAEFRNHFSMKRPVNGLIFHSDKGSQYAAYETRNHLQSMGYWQSMSGTGNCFDNAPMESFWHSLKVEETHGRGFATREEAKRCVFAYIEGFYNTRRMHSSIGWQSPRAFRAAFEQRAHQQAISGSPALAASAIERKPTRVTGVANQEDFSGELCTGRVELAGTSSEKRRARCTSLRGSHHRSAKPSSSTTTNKNSDATPLKSWGLITQ